MGFADALFALRHPVRLRRRGRVRRQQRWSRSATTRSRRPATSPPSAAATRRSTVRCGAAASCRSTRCELLAEAARDGDARRRPSARTLDWDALRERVLTRRHAQLQRDGDRADRDDLQHLRRRASRSSRCTSNLFVKSNMSGEFTVVNPHLVADLKARGLWDEVMVVGPEVPRRRPGRDRPGAGRPQELYATAFEIDPMWLVKAASRRQKWIDQAQSLNLYMAAPSGRALDELYRRRGDMASRRRTTCGPSQRPTWRRPR